jgi:SAM-dependent methyltransferase
MEYPIIDGIPYLVPDLRTFMSTALEHTLMRDDLPETIESLLGDCAGPGTVYDATRQYLSSYGWDHYSEFDPLEPSDDGRTSAVVRCLDACWPHMKFGSGPLLEVGASVGRSTFEMAARTDGLVLGIDLNIAMLRIAMRVLREGRVKYPRRRIGLVYDQRDFEVSFEAADRVDFWACDATALPVRAASVGAVVGLNILDTVRSPLHLFSALDRVVSQGGSLALCAPYDWAPTATPFEGWIGGHSQRGPMRGQAEPLIRSLLTPGAHPQAVRRLALVHEVADIPWEVRVHDRSTMHYSSHVVIAHAQ